MKRLALLFLLALSCIACKQERSGERDPSLFSLLGENQTGITFTNQVAYTESYNTYTYRNFYNGAGVGLGDFNRDGLMDIYFCGNILDNKLYINRGEFQFEEKTASAGVACSNVWCTGVSIVDINGDGWPDIYVCKSGDPSAPNRHNELFINNGDLTFTERAAEYGIDDLGLSTHATFFDYDRDGDLDCYLLNNSFQSVTEFDLIPDQRLLRDTLGGNKLYNNEGDYFLDVSEEAGIFGSKIGFGLGVSVADLNRDGWMDLYVSNDFFERDYLYINQKDGTFKEQLEMQIGETSLGAMGADVADINNDAFPDIFVTEMTAEGENRLKTKVLFEGWDRYQFKLKQGYHHQFARNVLQLNNRNNTFSEIGRLSGVDATDWSWGALIMDLDNDGWKDLYVANGIYKDLLDRDYLDLYSNPSVMRSMIETEEKAILKLIDSIPSERISNYAFRNNGDLSFTNSSIPWGLDQPSHSNGAAYGDLDNDGDLDLVVNNVNMPAFVYRNELLATGKSNYLMVHLQGAGLNSNAIGATVTLWFQGEMKYQEQVPMRGFKSSVDPRLHFGLGKWSGVDSLLVQWPDGSCSKLQDPEINQILALDQSGTSGTCNISNTQSTSVVLTEDANLYGLNYLHQDADMDDFDRDPLLFHMVSGEGPRTAVADINEDGLDDLYICGAKDFPGGLYIQGNNGDFTRTNRSLFEADQKSEDTDCTFFDADGDGDPDLYVTSGGNLFPSSSSALTDRLYLNDGSGEFSRSDQVLPAGRYESCSCVEPADYDLDGDMDLFVGVRLKPFLYGIPVNGYLLENDGTGQFTDVSRTRAPGLSALGMITDMTWTDLDGDKDLDMVVVGDWMPVKVYINEDGNFADRSDAYGLSHTEGWWHVVLSADLNDDGHMDLALGNQGLNSRFRVSPDRPVTMHVNDFDLNGSVEHILCTYNGEKSYPLVMKNDLVKQIPALNKKYPHFRDYKEQTITDIFSDEILQRSLVLIARTFESCVLINSGNGTFERKPLPMEAQFSPVYAMETADFDKDGLKDLLLGGNLVRAKPETGIYKASYGLLLAGSKNGSWKPVPYERSGFQVRGEIRNLQKITINKRSYMVVGRNNDILKLYSY